MLSDAAARQAALSPAGSFIVQAPAGSGKTELLTCRFLKLLKGVHSPEQVIALTFTRKAASEMRDRVLSMLERCRDQLAAGKILPVSWWQDAQDVLARDKQYQWQLLAYPFRLKIMTFDALCQGVVRATAGHSPTGEDNWLAEAEIARYPERFYLQAAIEGFQEALETPELQPALLCLVQHLDNRLDVLQQLGSALLRSRDQWLGVLYEAKTYSKASVEAALAHLQQQGLCRLVSTIPVDCWNRLQALCARVALYSPQWEALAHWQRDALTFAQAQLLTQRLLTTQHTLRKRWDHHVGLKRELFEAAVWQEIKEESTALLAQLAETSGCEAALEAFMQIPSADYEARQWEVLQALLQLLPRLVAHLKLIFRQDNQTDFIEIALAALEALGQDEQPTELALSLDQTIAHLLIDEFQDTSWIQFELLKRLTSGWQGDSDRSVLVVGDPMQSIYRFRQAEVGLFLKVQAEGLGDLPLTPLYLTANFRSASLLVAWVNQRMQGIFPARPDMAQGAVHFHASEAVHPATERAFVQAIETATDEAEAHAVLRLIQEAQARDPHQTIAVLVRSRALLRQIIPCLHAHEIPFEGVDLFPIFTLPHIQDLWSLLRVLLLPTERLSWFALLRSPYVGLTLEDLQALALLRPEGDLWPSLATLAQDSGLSAEGLARLALLVACLEEAWRLQPQFLLPAWVFRVHQRLQGTTRLTEAQCVDIERFFQVLETMVVHNTLVEWTLFEKACQSLFAHSPANAFLKIMTIHQAKGLEFDTVILPGLGRQTARASQPLLRWSNIIQSHQEPLWLVSPLKAAEEETSPLYAYLTYLESQKDAFEQQRLLYVAVTRAKQRLYLVDVAAKTASGFRALLKAEAFDAYQVDQLGFDSISAQPIQTLRLPLSTYQTPLLGTIAIGQTDYQLPAFSEAKTLGILTHRWLQWICEHHITRLDAMPWERIAQELTQAGVDNTPKALSIIKTQLSGLFKSERGRWLIAPHPKAHNEYSVTMRMPEGHLKTVIMDRIFEVDHQQWVIDFKTGQADEAAEAEHRVQLMRYAQCLKALGAAQVQCGIYYLAADRWVSWTALNA